MSYETWKTGTIPEDGFEAWKTESEGGFRGAGVTGTWEESKKLTPIQKAGQAVKELVAAPVRTVESMIGNLGGLSRMGAETATIGATITRNNINIPGAGIIAEHLIRKFGPDKALSFYDRKMQKYADSGKKISDFWAEQANKGWEAPNPDIVEARWYDPRHLTSVVMSGITSVGMMVGTAFLTKSPEVALMAMAGSETGAMYDRLRNKNVPPEIASKLAQMAGAWTYVTEKIPFEKLLTPANRSLIGALKQGGWEGSQEVVEQMGHNLLEYFGYDYRKPKDIPTAVKAAYDHIMDGWLDALVGGVGAGGLAHVAIHPGAVSPNIQMKVIDDVYTETKQRTDITPKQKEQALQYVGDIETRIEERIIDKFPDRIDNQESLERVGNAIARELGVEGITWIWNTTEKYMGRHTAFYRPSTKSITFNVNPLVVHDHWTKDVGYFKTKRGPYIESFTSIPNKTPGGFNQDYIKRVIVHELGHQAKPPTIGYTGRRSMHHAEFRNWVNTSIKNLFEQVGQKFIPIEHPEAIGPITKPPTVEELTGKTIEEIQPKTPDHAIGRQYGLTNEEVDNRLNQAELRYRELKQKETSERTAKERDELAFLSRERGNIESLLARETQPKAEPKIGEKVYHGTSIEAAKQIRKTGFKPGQPGGMTSQPIKEFVFVTPHKTTAKWFGEQNISFKGEYDVVEANLEGKLYEVKGKQITEYEAMGIFSDEFNLRPKGEHKLDLKKIADELRNKGYSGISFKDRNSGGRLSYAVLPEKLTVEQKPLPKKKYIKKELLQKGHQIPKQLGMTNEERINLQRSVTGKESMADMTKTEMIKWVDYLEKELTARGQIYKEQPEIIPQLIEQLKTRIPQPPTTTTGKVVSYLKSKLSGPYTDLIRIERWLEALDGYKEGPLRDTIWKPIKNADELRNMAINEGFADFFEMIEDQNIDGAVWTGAKETIREGLELTPFQKIGVYLLSQNEQGYKYLTKGMDISDEDIRTISISLTEEQLSVAAWLDEQYRSQWPIIRLIATDVGIDPKLLEQELNYSPIQRTDIEGDVDFTSLLTENFNRQSLKPEQGFLEKRQERAVGKIELDAGVIYLRNIQRIETFKAFAPAIKTLGPIFNNPVFRDSLNNVTEGRGSKILNTWLKDTVRNYIPGSDTWYAKTLSVMRKNGIVYAIGYNIPSSLRQTLSLSNAVAVDPLMLKYIPVNLSKATTNYEEMKDFVEERSALVRTREFDRDLKKKWGVTALGKRLAGKTPWSERATSWIRWVDKHTVVVAWKSLYDTALEKGMDESTAIEYADKWTGRVQEMANMKDLPHFFRGGTLEQLLSTFQNQVNNIGNFYVHDILGTAIAGKLSMEEVVYRVMFSYVLPAILYGMIGRGGLPLTDEWKINWQAIGVDLATYPVAPFMVVGRWIDRMITGWGQSGTVAEIAPEEAIRTAQAVKRGDIGGMIKHAAATIGAVTGKIPAQAIRTTQGALDLLAGTTKDPRRLIYSQWALDQQKQKVPTGKQPGPAGRK